MLTALKRLVRSNGNVSLRDYTRLAVDLLALYKFNTTSTITKLGFSVECLYREKDVLKVKG